MKRQTPTPSPARALRRRRGLGIVELLISLAITSMLLSAIAAAYLTSSQVIENNDKFFRATQAARVALTQMLTEVRRCDSIPIDTVSSPYKITATILPILRPDYAPKQPNEFLRVYEYEPANRRIVLFFRYINGTESARYPIASNVETTPFDWREGTDAANNACVLRVSIIMEVKVDNQTIRISGSAAPRRSMTFR